MRTRSLGILLRVEYEETLNFNMHPKHREVSKSDKSIELLNLNRSSRSDSQRNSGPNHGISA